MPTPSATPIVRIIVTAPIASPAAKREPGERRSPRSAIRPACTDCALGEHQRTEQGRDEERLGEEQAVEEEDRNGTGERQRDTRGDPRPESGAVASERRTSRTRRPRASAR